MEHTIALGLGSNLGNRLDYLRQACEQLAGYLFPTHYSAIYETPALLPENAPASWDMPYLNMTVLAITDLSPPELLKATQHIEQALGRDSDKAGSWAPRIIDIDILLYSDQVIVTDNLIIPHAALTERDFFLLPLAEIAPDWHYPNQGKYYQQSMLELAKKFIHNNSITKTQLSL